MGDEITMANNAIKGLNLNPAPVKRELRNVSLKEVHDWLQENLRHTWYQGKGGHYDVIGSDNPGTGHFKYLYLTLDTRTMDIFHIGSDRESSDFREAMNGGETILDLLTYHTQNRTVPTTAKEGSLERSLQAKFPDLDFGQIKEALAFIKEECIETLFTNASEPRSQFEWDKKQFTYHQMKDEFGKIIGELNG